MLPTERDRLRHMLDAAREATDMVRDRSRADLDSDRSLAYSLVWLLTVVGEAASKVPAPMRAAHPEVPWALVAATRHRLVHAYFDINRDVVWETATKDLPPLIAQLQAILDGGTD